MTSVATRQLHPRTHITQFWSKTKVSQKYQIQISITRFCGPLEGKNLPIQSQTPKHDQLTIMAMWSTVWNNIALNWFDITATKANTMETA